MICTGYNEAQKGFLFLVLMNVSFFYLINKYFRDIRPNDWRFDPWIDSIETQFSHVRSKNLTEFFNKEED